MLLRADRVRDHRRRADVQDLREREHDEPEIAGGAEARGHASLPSMETNFRSVKKYAICTTMPMNIWIDIDATCPGIEPMLRSFMGYQKGGGLNDRAATESSTAVDVRDKRKGRSRDRPFA